MLIQQEIIILDLELIGGTFKQLTITPGSDVSISAGTEYTLNSNSTNSGSMIINASNTTDNSVFKTYDAGSNPTGKFIFFKIQGTVRSVSSVSTSSVYSGHDQLISATLDGSLPTGQGVYLRYTNDSWNSSTIVEMSGSGASYNANIPASVNTSGASISYYISPPEVDCPSITQMLIFIP